MSKRFCGQEKVFLFWSLIVVCLFYFLSGSPTIASDESKGDIKSPGQIVANPNNGNKVTSHGGYSRLFSKAQTHGRIRIIVRIAVPYNPESLLSDQERPKQRAEISDKQNKLLDDIKSHNHKVVIVSGLAYGIDICAHRAALKNGLETIAVLGHGLASLYPSVHKATAKEITKQGALVTDFISDALIDRNNFIKRNRIIAGLADVTIVIESAMKGGALITADIAGSYNRDVMAFPGMITDTYSTGCNWLIRTNKASLIEGINDIEYLLGWDSQKKPCQHNKLNFLWIFLRMKK